ncbi:Crp/Fnr family transcriptional regulator [Bacillaceae bacterium SIJ1]|uniref:Crp/Fnr family transcriptional regulator n=1 Tax=Litoribacterium kuwaitense TaxID=1398745 RepID=UPI0013EB8BE5|nr:Crp/Fnr family transcriptional regulator [Litoribacterium kuwaitense]NGP46417.1 Crp/Fnr family transcriptional regulator [Litoribacterium kuwaitense]
MKIIQDPAIFNQYVDQHQLHRWLHPTDMTIELRRYKENEVLLFEGDEIDGLYIQVSGRTRITTSVLTGKALLLRFCYAGSVMGDLELVQRLDVQSQVMADEETDVLFIHKREVEGVLFHQVAFLQELLKQVTYKLNTCTIASRVNVLSSVETRLASYLCSIRHYERFGKELYATSQKDIAALLGTTPRHLNRVLDKWLSQKVIAKDRTNIEVLDWEAIEDLSEGLRYK